DAAGRHRVPAGLRGAADRGGGPGDRRRAARRQAMRRWALALVGLLLATGAVRGGDAPEPDGYWTGEYRASTPATLQGARVVTTAEAKQLWDAKEAIFVDVMPHAPRPPNLPAGTIWPARPP